MKQTNINLSRLNIKKVNKLLNNKIEKRPYMCVYLPLSFLNFLDECKEINQCFSKYTFVADLVADFCDIAEEFNMKFTSISELCRFAFYNYIRENTLFLPQIAKDERFRMDEACRTIPKEPLGRNFEPKEFVPKENVGKPIRIGNKNYEIREVLL